MAPLDHDRGLFENFSFCMEQLSLRMNSMRETCEITIVSLENGGCPAAAFDWKNQIKKLYAAVKGLQDCRTEVMADDSAEAPAEELSETFTLAVQEHGRILGACLEAAVPGELIPSLYDQVIRLRHLKEFFDELRDRADRGELTAKEAAVYAEKLLRTTGTIRALLNESDEKGDRDVRPFLFLRFFGFPAMAIAILSLVIYLVVPMYYRYQMRDTRPMPPSGSSLSREEIELYQEASWQWNLAVGEMYSKNVLYRVADPLRHWAAASCMIYFVVGHIAIAMLEKKKEKSAPVCFMLAWLYVDPGIKLFFMNPVMHEHYMLEAAQLDYAPAYLRLGYGYEKGWGFSFEWITPDRLQTARGFYRKALPLRGAVRGYERVSKKLEAMKQ